MATWSNELGYSKDKTDVGGLIDTSILQKLKSSPAGAGDKPTAKEGA
jgi:hypothetical protein